MTASISVEMTLTFKELNTHVPFGVIYGVAKAWRIDDGELELHAALLQQHLI